MEKDNVHLLTFISPFPVLCMTCCKCIGLERYSLNLYVTSKRDSRDKCRDFWLGPVAVENKNLGCFAGYFVLGNISARESEYIRKRIYQLG